MLTDTHRIAKLTCALGPDALVLYRMRGREELGRLAAWDLDLFAERSDLDIATMLGSDLSLRSIFRRRRAAIQRHRRGVRAGAARQHEAEPPGAISGDRAATPLVAHARVALPLLLSEDSARNHRPGAERLSRRLREPVLGHISESGALRAVSRDRLRFRQPARRARRHLLLLRTRGGKHKLVLTDSSQVHAAMPHYAPLPIGRKPRRPASMNASTAGPRAARCRRASSRRTTTTSKSRRKASSKACVARGRGRSATIGRSTRCRNTGSATRGTTTPNAMRRRTSQAHQAANVSVRGRATARGIWPGSCCGCRAPADGTERRIPRRRGGLRTQLGRLSVHARRARLSPMYSIALSRRCRRDARVSRGAHHAARACRRAADGGGRRADRRGNPHRQIRPHQGAVPLGAARGRVARDAATLLGARRAAVGRQGLRRVFPAAHRPGSAGRFHRRRSGPAARHRQRL